MTDQPELYGPNEGYVAELYERYLADPNSVDTETRALFSQGWRPTPPSSVSSSSIAAAPTSSQVSAADIDRAVRAGRLIRLVRELGHMDAHLDPLGGDPPGDPELTFAFHGLTEADLAELPASVVGGPLAEGAANALEAYNRLREVYCGPVGYEDDHIHIPAERSWLREAMESRRFFNRITDEDRKWLLKRLTKVDTFEQFLHKSAPFQGQKRFSIEGLDILVPMLDATIRDAANAGTQTVVIGMAHRGRLNVLAHTLGKPYEIMLSEFPTDQKAAEPLASVSGGGSHGYTGDVKYHKGWTSRAAEAGHDVRITLAPNPSHLEFVDPVVIGGTRAAQDQREATGVPAQDEALALAILIHGDAAFPGQGVVPETLNLANLPGYDVGGTIHIIANNQVGFTTDPKDSRSTLYASDLAKGFEIPIVHVNGDDPEACLAVARMAIAYRQTFGKDFLIDVVGYRRWGHNETDEPRYTQPTMYQKIDARPRLRALWAQALEERGLIASGEADALVEACRQRLTEARDAAKSLQKHFDTNTEEVTEPASTAIAEDRLRALNGVLNSTPSGFTPNPKQEKAFLEPRRAALDSAEPKINWAHAEALAFGSLLEDGIPVRLTGQDSERGTFSQRMLVLHDPNTGNEFCGLRSLPEAKATLALHNSPLSETAVLGFEYGYAVAAPETLVLWEAQFGDFANGAQVIIDQFLASGGAKWGQHVGLTLLLPHGYEGQGPEHSSARLERFLQLGAGDNIHICNCTTAGQYFHLLRRQAISLQSQPRPLVVMTPKYLLRHPRACATLADLTQGQFQPVLDDPRDAKRKKSVSRLILCSGKVYVDLVYDAMPPYGERSEYSRADFAAVARIEQLFPLPAAELEALIASYPNLREVVWLQEEPKNMGAWSYIAPRLMELLPDGTKLRYVGRMEAASPAEGSVTAHNAEQQRLLIEALTPPPTASSNGNGNGKHKNGTGPIPGKENSVLLEESKHVR
ncbi:MAG: 2-oxoglutarate dehydrogenase E1 component [Armatimonas sp.]